ncbi:hypothetical protein [Paenibacillus sp. URB8-2]|uniref:hypothetical protein n=1 Tax=Paenibacillus sp. URB8-2 TaxID=2741301 RepID=UPI0015BAA24D|nr:hypothetical protein [Paenibacillus sp. URB8-2]BCG58519.1 hypothetical protein PUR_19440 [Paenibacillus sp. URB8-2]
MATVQGKLFKVTYSNWYGAVRGQPFRKIAIEANAPLYDLAVATIDPFDFDLQKMLLLYDYGDEWRIIVQYLGDTEVHTVQRLPLIVVTKGEALDQYKGFEHEESEEEWAADER